MAFFLYIWVLPSCALLAHHCDYIEHMPGKTMLDGPDITPDCGSMFLRAALTLVEATVLAHQRCLLPLRTCIDIFLPEMHSS
jgi:hypothetical protein